MMKERKEGRNEGEESYGLLNCESMFWGLGE